MDVLRCRPPLLGRAEYLSIRGTSTIEKYGLASKPPWYQSSDKQHLTLERDRDRQTIYQAKHDSPSLDGFPENGGRFPWS
jgi:hypothetical protein